MYASDTRSIGDYAQRMTATDGAVREEDILRLVESRRDASFGVHQTYWRKIRGYYDFWRGVYAGNFPQHRNNIHIPILFAKIWSDVAYKVMQTWGTYPYVQFHGAAPEDAPGAAKVGALVNAQLMDTKSFEKAVDFYSTADIYGTSVARLGWKNKTRDRMYRTKVADYEFKMKKKVTMFDGPEWDNIDILDFWPQPWRKRIDDMDWCIHRYYADLDDILEEQRGPYPKFDRAAVQRLRSTPMTMPMQDMLRERLNIYRNFAQWQGKSVERYARPVELWEMWGTVPDEFAVQGCRDVVITVANNRVVLRYEPNPFWHGEKPFIAHSPCPDPHYFHGYGRIEAGQKMQAASNRIINQKLDNGDLFYDAMWVAAPGVLDVQNMFTKPGRVFQANGPVGEDQLRELRPNIEGSALAFQDLAALKQMISETLGISGDTVEGTAPSNRATAREVMIRREASMSRLGMEAALWEKAFVEPLADQCHDLNQQFLSLPKQIHMIGSAAIIDPTTGMPLAPENHAIDVNDLAGASGMGYKAKALGASQSMSKSLKAQAMMLGLQAASSNQVGMQVTNWVAFFTELYRSLDLDPVQMIVQQGVPAINQMAQEQQKDPRQIVEEMAASQQGLPNFQGAGGAQPQGTQPYFQPENVIAHMGGDSGAGLGLG